MIRVLYILSLFTFAIGTLGCARDISPGVDVEHATRVTFAQFKEAAQGERSVYWVGSDKDFHYFETPKGFYRLPAQFKMPDFQKWIDVMISR